MQLKVTRQADHNRTVNELMLEVDRTGNRYLDLATGSFVSIAEDAPPVKTKPKGKSF